MTFGRRKRKCGTYFCKAMTLAVPMPQYTWPGMRAAGFSAGIRPSCFRAVGQAGNDNAFRLNKVRILFKRNALLVYTKCALRFRNIRFPENADRRPGFPAATRPYAKRQKNPRSSGEKRGKLMKRNFVVSVHFTRFTYEPSRVSTSMSSPSFINNGTRTSAPVSTFAGFVALVAVSPLSPGSVYAIFKTVFTGISA